MESIILVHLQLPKVEKPYGPPIVVYDELGLRTLFLGILANPEFSVHYEFPCFAEAPGTKQPTLESLEGSAIYQKSGGKLIERFASGPFIGLLDCILPAREKQSEPH